GAELAGGSDHVLHRRIARAGQPPFITAGAAADHVADGGEHVAEDVGADDRLAVDQPEVLLDACSVTVRDDGGEEEFGVVVAGEPSHVALLRDAAPGGESRSLTRLATSRVDAHNRAMGFVIWT